MATTSSRYLRYIIFSIFGVLVIYVLTSSSIPVTIPNASGVFKTNPSTQQVGSDIIPTSEKPASSWSLPPEKVPVVVDKQGGVSDNPSHGLPPAKAPGERVNATFVTLARNTDIWELARSIRNVEDRFNRQYNYDWVFLNNEPFDEDFKKLTTALVSGTTHYGVIPEAHWSFPDFIDQDKAAKVREDMRNRKIIYGDSVSYRHMCRFESGFFFRHELMQKFEYYWRVEPSVQLFCDIAYDPFKYMKDNKKKYSFVLSLYEYVDTIPTLWDSVKGFMKKHPEHIAKDNGLAWLSDDNGDTYNHCHFWSNFEIGDLRWLRSKAYVEYFDYLDRDGGFFYERWGDAPVHSIAAALMLKKDEIHFFNDIGYYHVPFTHCPTGEDVRLKLKCHCDPKENFDWQGYSCTTKWHDVANLPKPAGWEAERDRDKH